MDFKINADNQSFSKLLAGGDQTGECSLNISGSVADMTALVAWMSQNQDHRESPKPVREVTITEQVSEFFAKFCYANNLETGPIDHMSAGVGAFRVKLLVEEFTELMVAMGLRLNGWNMDLQREAEGYTQDHPQIASVNIENIAQELADLDYVIEGTRIILGIPRAPVAAEVHRANMEKVRANDGTRNPMKPDGWIAPRVQDVLDRERKARE